MSVLISSPSGDSSPARLLEEQLVQASPDLLRELLTTFVNNTLMSAEADAVCGAAYGTEDQRVAATEASHASEGQQERSTQVLRASANRRVAYASRSDGKVVESL